MFLFAAGSPLAVALGPDETSEWRLGSAGAAEELCSRGVDEAPTLASFSRRAFFVWQVRELWNLAAANFLFRLGFS